MEESGGGEEALEHTALALLLALSSAARTVNWLLLLMVHMEEVEKACMLMVDFKR